jgi:hypothetical protein
MLSTDKKVVRRQPLSIDLAGTIAEPWRRAVETAGRGERSKRACFGRETEDDVRNSTPRVSVTGGRGAAVGGRRELSDALS